MTDDNRPAETGPNSEEPTQTEYVERSDVGVSLMVKLKRGTQTRDQDELTAKVKARTLAEAREDMETLRAYLHELAEDIRQIQPSDEAE